MKVNSSDGTERKERLKTIEVSAGDLLFGHLHPIRIQTMTTTDTMDTMATVKQVIACAAAGADLVRITAPGQRDAENLLAIKNKLREEHCHIPLVADIHFTPRAAEIAARIVEKVRINPGNYADRKKFEIINYTDDNYNAELDRIERIFSPLVKICKEYGTALRIGTNHGSLSDRIMSRFGDTPVGMVESAMEFLRIAERHHFRNIILSMKSSRPLIMVEAYHLLVRTMQDELGHCYPLHLGVTEAGDGLAGRLKSAIGIGTLLEDGIGDTIRVSLTEDPVEEVSFCRHLITRYTSVEALTNRREKQIFDTNSNDRDLTQVVCNIGGNKVPVVIADYSHLHNFPLQKLNEIGYSYNPDVGKWSIANQAADYIFTMHPALFPLPGALKVITPGALWKNIADKENYFPLFTPQEYLYGEVRSAIMNVIEIDADDILAFIANNRFDESNTIVFLIHVEDSVDISKVVQTFSRLRKEAVNIPFILQCNAAGARYDKLLLHVAINTGVLILNGWGSGLWLKATGKTVPDISGTLSNIAFGILQATHTRISATEYVSCPSCGRTLFDLQEITSRIRAATDHLKDVKIAIMGCIVNGPGEMADAHFGYVGSGRGRVSLYKGKEVVRRNIDSNVAVASLIELIKASGMWIDPDFDENIHSSF